MQLPNDAALAAAVASNNRVVVSELKADWNRDGLYAHALSDLTEWVESVSVQRDIIGTLPEETTTIEGFIGAQLDFTLSGTRPRDSKDVVQLLSPLRADSPLYGDSRTGIPIKWRLGMQTAAGTIPMMDQFTGTISAFRADSGARTVVVSCLDGIESLHAPINLPVFQNPDWESNQTRLGQYRINSHWVIDYVLRQNGIYQSPPMQPGCIYSATGHGSMVPELGHQFTLFTKQGTFTEDDTSTVPGKWGYAYNGTGKFMSVWSARANAAFTPTVGRSWLIQLMVYGPGVPLQISATGDFVVTISTDSSLFAPGATTLAYRIARTGQMFADFYNGASLINTIAGPSVSSVGGWQYCFVLVDFAGATLNNCAVSFPNESHSGVNLTGLSLAPVTYPYPAVMTGAGFPVQNIQINDATGIAPPFYDTSFVSQCDLDIGLNEFPALPLVRGSDSLDVLKSVIGSEFGVGGFSESGRFYFRNRNTVRKNNLQISRAYTADQNLQLAASEPPGSVRNSVTTKVRASFRVSAYQEVWTPSSTEDFQILPGTNTFRVTLDRPCLLNDFSPLTFTSMAFWDVEPTPSQSHKFHAIDSLNNPVPGVTVAVRFDPVALAQGRDEVIITVTSPIADTVRFSTTDGRPALSIDGLPAVDGAETLQTYERANSIARFRRQVLPLDLDPWRQLQKFQQPIALGLLKDLKAPIPIFDQIQVVGDPRSQLQDSLQLGDTEGLGGPVTVGIEALRRDLSGGKLTDQLTVRMFSRPGRWILGDPVLSILGSTTILG